MSLRGQPPSCILSYDVCTPSRFTISSQSSHRRSTRMSQHDVNRRTITKGLAWAVPAVSAAAALPAYAVSCPGTAAAEIDSWFAEVPPGA